MDINISKYSDFLSDKRLVSLRGFNQSYACTMLVFFCFMPILALFSPNRFGSIFKTLTYIELASLLVLGMFQLVSYASFESEEYSLIERIKICFSNMLNSLINNKTGLLLLAVYLISIISAFFAKDVKRAFFGTDFRPDGILMYTSLAVIFIYSSLVKGRIQRRIIFGINIFGFILCSLIMLQQYYGIIGSAGVKSSGELGGLLISVYDSMGIRIGHFFKGFTGPFYNLNHMGYYIMINSILISAFVIISENKFIKTAFSILAAYSYYILTINDTFGCYIAVLLTLVLIPAILLLKFRKKALKFIVNSLIPLILFLSVAVGFSLLDGSDNIVSKNFKTLGKDVENVASSDDLSKDKSGSGRMSLWIATIDMIAQKPLLGYGPDNLKEHYVEREQKVDRAHNEPLERAVATGIPSAIIYYAAIAWCAYKFIRRSFSASDKDMLIGFMIIFSYLISSLFGVFLFYTAWYFISALAIVSSDSFGHAVFEPDKKRSNRKKR